MNKMSNEQMSAAEGTEVKAARKLPGKKGKGDTGTAKQEQKVTVASVDGTLRRLREKDLLLEIPRKAVLRFRLIPKTHFEDKAGEPIRESLLHPGDQLSVQVSPDGSSAPSEPHPP